MSAQLNKKKGSCTTCFVSSHLSLPQARTRAPLVVRRLSGTGLDGGLAPTLPPKDNVGAQQPALAVCVCAGLAVLAPHCPRKGQCSGTAALHFDLPSLWSAVAEPTARCSLPPCTALSLSFRSGERRTNRRGTLSHHCTACLLLSAGLLVPFLLIKLKTMFKQSERFIAV